MIGARPLATTAALAALLAAGPAAAQVEVQALQAPDLFSAQAYDTGLGQDLWRGTSADIARAVIPDLAARPTTPAFAGLARRVLATGAQAPEGAGSDLDLAAARAAALLALGEAAGVLSIVDRTPGSQNSPALSQAAAEAALVLGEDDRACAVGDALVQGREEPYWPRLRAFCLARAGDQAGAQLAYDLSEAQIRDAVVKRLLNAAVSGAAPGAASLRNGLEYALSRHLKLDLVPAMGSAWAPIAVAVAVQPAPPPPVPAEGEPPAGPALPQAQVAAQLRVEALGLRPAAARAAPGGAFSVDVLPGPGLAGAWEQLRGGRLAQAREARAILERNDAAGVTVLELALLDAALTAAEGRGDQTVLDQLVERGGAGAAAQRARAQQAAAVYSALGAPMSPRGRAEFAGFDLAAAKAPAARLLALDAAAEAGARGETALVALWIALESGAAGPPAAERARIVRALNRVGLDEDARAIAVEAFRPPPPAPARAAGGR